MTVEKDYLEKEKDYLDNPFNLEGLCIGVTGGGGHLGRAIVLQALALGASVLACGRSAGPLDTLKTRVREEGLPGKLYTSRADLGVDEQLETLLELAENRLGGLDGWVNNASAAQMTLMPGLSRQAVEETLKSELSNTIMATDAAAQLMKKSGRGGSIVNIASMYGLVSPQPETYADYPRYHNPPAYGAAKAGVVQFTRYAACHLGKDGIRVNAISPGPFPRDKIRAEKGFKEELASRVPLCRVGDRREVAGAVLFLLTPAASYITGHNLVVDGGWTAW